MRARFLVVATLAGAAVLFIWQAISNGPLQLPERGMKPFPTDSMAVAAKRIRALAPQNGLYVSSYGVLAAVDISSDYADKGRQFVSTMVKQFVLDLGVVLILALLIDRLADPSIVRTGMIFATLALALMGMTDVANGIWWNYPRAWTLGNLADQAISFFLVGVTLAALRRRYSDARVATAERPSVRAPAGFPTDAGTRVGR